MTSNIFSLLTKYAKNNQQYENQCTLSLVSVLNYYPDLLHRFTNYFLEITGQNKIRPSDNIIVVPHPQEKREKTGVPDLLIKRGDKNLLLFEMKINAKITEKQYEYYKSFNCPLIFILKYLPEEMKEKKNIYYLTWNEVGKLCDEFLKTSKIKDKKLIKEFVEFLKEEDMYISENILSKQNLDELGKFFLKIRRSDADDLIVRKIPDIIALLNFIYKFLDNEYSRLIESSGISYLKYLNSNNEIYISPADEKDKETSIFILRKIFVNNSYMWGQVGFGWKFDFKDNSNKVNWKYIFYHNGDINKESNKKEREKFEYFFKDKDDGLKYEEVPLNKKLSIKNIRDFNDKIIKSNKIKSYLSFIYSTEKYNKKQN